MDRRDLLKFLAFSSAVPVLPAGVLAALREIHSSLGSGVELKALSPHQNATVAAMAELIIPATDTPGAKDVRVGEFIDHILADWYPEEDRKRFLNGLAGVDSRAQNLFHKNFQDASPLEQGEILRALGEEMAQANAEIASGPRGYRGALPAPEENFYFMFRQLVLTGYFTSEAGYTQQLHEEIIPGRYEGCAPIPAPARAKGL